MASSARAFISAFPRTATVNSQHTEAPWGVSEHTYSITHETMMVLMLMQTVTMEMMTNIMTMVMLAILMM